MVNPENVVLAGERDEEALRKQIGPNYDSCKYAARILRDVSDNIWRYVPYEVLLDDAELVVRIPSRDTMPTVEIRGSMPVPAIMD